MAVSGQAANSVNRFLWASPSPPSSPKLKLRKNMIFLIQAKKLNHPWLSLISICLECCLGQSNFLFPSFLFKETPLKMLFPSLFPEVFQSRIITEMLADVGSTYSLLIKGMLNTGRIIRPWASQIKMSRELFWAGLLDSVVFMVSTRCIIL